MKRQQQLGMNPSTASHRLVKDILWKLIVQTKQDICCKCNQQMTRETFSIEHIVPWMDSENPLELYFNLDNISFSHLVCNIKSARRGLNKKYFTENDRLEASRKSKRKYQTTEKRREHYLKTGN